MNSGYKKVRSRPRQRDNYIDPSIVDKDEPPTRKLLRENEQKPYIKTERINNLRMELDSNNSFFKTLRLPPLTPFLEYSSKAECKCKRKMRFYCCKCLTKNPDLPFPKVKLPCDTIVLHHPEEKVSKSSALPLIFLSEQISKMDYKEDLSEQFSKFDESSTYILYPHKQSLKVSELQKPPKIIIAVDCTWFQTNTILRHLQIAKQKSGKNIKYIKLDDYETQFWRYQNHGDKALATAQAIYYFYKEYAMKFQKGYQGQYDELLYLFVLNYNIIQQYHKGQKEEKRQKSEKQVEDKKQTKD